MTLVTERGVRLPIFSTTRGTKKERYRKSTDPLDFRTWVRTREGRKGIIQSERRNELIMTDR